MGGVATKEEDNGGGDTGFFWNSSKKSDSNANTPESKPIGDATVVNASNNPEEDKQIAKKSPQEFVKGIQEDVAVRETEEESEQEPFDPEDYDPKKFGPILPNGEINWECPCLGGAAHGPCGNEFRGAFSCFHFSKEDPKGADCFPSFKEMHSCFSKYPELYKSPEDEEDDEAQEEENEEEVQFDEEELRVINEEDDNEKKVKKQEPEPSHEVEKKDEKSKARTKPVVKPLIPSGGQPAMI